jgi:tetratricopeptide (TPR) repeat protein
MSEILSIKELVKEAQRAYQGGDYLLAARTFEAAANALTAQGNLLEAAEQQNNACVAYLQAGESQAAVAAVERTVEVFAAAGDVRRQGLALGNLGSALEAAGRLDEAALAYQRSAEALRDTGETQMRLHVLQSLSALQLRTGRQLQALATMQAGLNGAGKLTVQQRMLKKILDIPFKMLGR